MRLRPALVTLESRSLLSAVSATAQASGSSIVAWNQQALDAIRAESSAPPVAARALAIVEIAVENAIHASDRLYHGPASGRDTAAAAAADTAAFRVLLRLFPNEAAGFNALYNQQLVALGSSSAVTLGVGQGNQAALWMLYWRANDGSQTTTTYPGGTTPGQWRPTPPAYAAAVLPGWGRVTPFDGPAITQLRTPGPPALTSSAYAAALAQVEAIGSVNSTVRTADQTQITHFWSDGSGTDTPPGHWNAIADNLVTSRQLNLRKTARLMATLDAALADAAIACWSTKFTVGFWRPITAIREADTDGNPQTTADPSWTPLLVTPAFPSYVSGHSTFSAAAATVLSAYFGANTTFDATSDGLPGVTRHYTSFAQAASEAGMSRIYGGIHFAFDNTDGLVLGRQVGQIALRHARTGSGF